MNVAEQIANNLLAMCACEEELPIRNKCVLQRTLSVFGDGEES